MNMRKKVLFIVIAAATLIASKLIVNDYVGECLFFGAPVESLTYGEGPGDENHRHNQAANCPTDYNSWNIKPTCCWGYETCNYQICERLSGC